MNLQRSKEQKFDFFLDALFYGLPLSSDGRANYAEYFGKMLRCKWSTMSFQFLNFSQIIDFCQRVSKEYYASYVQFMRSDLLKRYYSYYDNASAHTSLLALEYLAKSRALRQRFPHFWSSLASEFNGKFQ